MIRRLGRHAESLVLPALLFAAWWILSSASTSIYFPPLREILAELWAWLPDEGMEHLGPSLRNLAIGYLIAVVAGVGLGLAFGLLPRLRLTASPVYDFLRSVPPPALLPVFVVLLGIGATMKVGVIAMGAVWPVLLSTIDGVRRVDPELRDVARVFKLGRLRELVTVIVPGATPSIIAGMRTSLGIGVILIVISEMVASTEGVGYYIIQSQRSFRIVDMWVGIVAIGIIGFVLSFCLAALQRRLVFWTRTGAT